MFRRLQSGLPKDPVYPVDLEGLGYFINDQDEIRSIENPKAYFKFFLTKNDRYNCVQREAMNECIRSIIAERLTSLGLEKIRLPLGASANEPNLPIFISSNLAQKKRVVILFYEHTQDLGVLAHRIIGGKGGINKGSAVDIVKYIQAQGKNADNGENGSPGIILANMGQLRWWRRGKKAVTQASWFALPAPSAVEGPYRFDSEKNTIPGNRNAREHVEYIFDHVVEERCHKEAKIQVIGVSEGAVRVAEFLDWPANWERWGHRMSAFAAVATYYHGSDYKFWRFKEWFAKRGRTYITSPEPASVFLSPHTGTKRIPAYGSPVFSLSEPYYSECLLPKGYKTIIDWFEEVAADPEYENPIFQRYDDEDEDEEEPQEPGIELELNYGVKQLKLNPVKEPDQELNIDSPKERNQIESISNKEPGREQQAQALELPLTPIKEPHQIPGVDLNGVLKIGEGKSVDANAVKDP